VLISIATKQKHKRQHSFLEVKQNVCGRVEIGIGGTGPLLRTWFFFRLMGAKKQAFKLLELFLALAVLHPWPSFVGGISDWTEPGQGLHLIASLPRTFHPLHAINCPASANAGVAAAAAAATRKNPPCRVKCGWPSFPLPTILHFILSLSLPLLPSLSAFLSFFPPLPCTPPSFIFPSRNSP